jgi:hypothetical protein
LQASELKPLKRAGNRYIKEQLLAFKARTGLSHLAASAAFASATPRGSLNSGFRVVMVLSERPLAEDARDPPLLPGGGPIFSCPAEDLRPPRKKHHKQVRKAPTKARNRKTGIIVTYLP